MSVIFTPRARFSRWKALWPLALLLAVSIIGGIWLWRAWPQVLMQSAVWQRSLNLELSRLLQAVAENPAAAGLSLLGFSFVYGVLHALGPGHGKIVITTWLATHPAKLKSSIGLTLAASLLQGLVAIALVVVVLALLQLPACQLHLSSFWLEKGSYLLVGALGLLLCWRALKSCVCCCAGQRLPLLLRIMFITNTAAAGISISGPGAAAGWRRLAGSRRDRPVDGYASLLGGDHGSAVQQGNRRFWLGDGGGAGDGGGNLVDYHGAGAVGAWVPPTGDPPQSPSGASVMEAG